MPYKKRRPKDRPASAGSGAKVLVTLRNRQLLWISGLDPAAGRELCERITSCMGKPEVVNAEPFAALSIWGEEIVAVQYFPPKVETKEDKS